MKDIWSTNGGLFVGYAADKPSGEPPRLDNPLLYTGDRGVITTGPNGSGKSRRSLLQNVCRLIGWSKVIVDPKGIICKMTKAHLEAAGNKVIVLNPHNVLDMGSHGCNLLQSMGSIDAAGQLTDDFPDDATAHAEANIKIEGREPHFAQAAQDFSSGVLMWIRLILADGSYEDFRRLISLSDNAMQAFVGSDEFEYRKKKYLGLVAAGIEHGWEEIGIKTARFGEISPDNKEQHSVLSTALTQTRYLDSRAIKRDLKGPKFDFSILKKEPTTVFIILPAKRLVTHARWIRLVITTILQYLMQDTHGTKVPTLLAIDEYPAIAGLSGDGFPIIERNLPMMREYGIKPWLLMQDLPQLQKCNPNSWETILGNAGIVQSFAPQELTTSKYLSEMCGQATRMSVSASNSRQRTPGAAASLNESVNVSQIPVPLMLPQEVRAMSKGFTLVTSDKAEGPFFSYLPYPTELKHMKSIMALDPSS